MPYEREIIIYERQCGYWVIGYVALPSIGDDCRLTNKKSTWFTVMELPGDDK